MAGLLKASSIIQPAYLSPHRKRRNPLLLLSCKTYDRELRLDTLGLKGPDLTRGRRPVRTARRIAARANYFRPVALAGSGDWFSCLNLETSFSHLSSTLKVLPIGSVGISSAPVVPTDSLELADPAMTYPLLNFLLEAYSSFHGQALVAAFFLAAIVVVATFIARSGDESQLQRAENSLNFVSRPSQFNQFVSMRCPSMSMNLPAQIPVLGRVNLEYQTVCLHAPDGGVVAIDWPAELDFFTEDNRLANTLLLVPGTTEGSEDEGVKRFVIDAMHYGYFPVILNGRGCARSPVTTARVFSGADSDDVRLAVQHIVRERPGSSLMGVGWGWGANMLTKYLGEESGSTSLIAAVAISNPFDLQQSSMYLGMSNAGQLDRVMAKGLVSILEENKVLFAGQNKDFNLKSAMKSTSIREFDSSISRVTFGFDTLDEYYSYASSARYISTVQVPLLTVQGEDFSMPVTSIPYSILESNPFTAACVAQNPASNISPAKEALREPGSASKHLWSHTVAFEWLVAVEVALLKGHHPLVHAVSSFDKVSFESKARVQPSLPMDVSIEGINASRSHEDSKMDTSVKDEKISEDEGEDELMQVESLSVAARDDGAGETEGFDENDAAEYTKGRVSDSKAESSPSNMEETPQEVESVPSKEDSLSQEAESISAETKSTPEEAESISAKTKSTPEEAESISAETKGTPQEAESSLAEAKNTSPEDEGSSSEPTSPPEEGETEEAADAIQMRQAAESVMNVLDITMPGTLSEEKKAQVLTAVGEGESILTALQEAVPEDVRGNMAAAVSGAVQARGLSFNLVGFGKGMPPPRLPAGLIESIKGKIAGGKKKESTPPTPPLPVDGPTSEGIKDTNAAQSTSSDQSEGHADPPKHNSESQKADNQGAVVEKEKGVESEDVPSDVGTEHNVVKPEDKSQSGGEDHNKGEPSKGSKEPKSEESKDNTESKPSGGKHEEVKSEESKEKAEGKPVGGKPEESNTEDPKERNEGKPSGEKHEEPKSEESKEKAESKPVGEKQEEPVDKHGAEQMEDKKDGTQEAPVGEVARTDDKKPDDAADSNGSTNAKEETKPADVKQSTPDAPVPASAPPPAPSPESTALVTPPKTGVAPPLDMRLAFQALTGFDDSTQMAVTNVFGVVESMLEKLEQEQIAAGPDASAKEKETSDEQESINGKEKDKGPDASSKAKGASDDQENSNGKGKDKKDDDKNVEGKDKKEDDKNVVNDSPPKDNEEDGARETAAVTSRGSNDADGGENDSNTQETAKSGKGETAQVATKKQEQITNGNEISMSVPEDPKQMKKNMVNISSSSQGLNGRLQSNVMMTQRVGSSTLVEPMLKDQPLQKNSSPTVNGAFPKNGDASSNRKGSETQVSREPVEEPSFLKPVVSRMTIEQLSKEVDDERTEKVDDSPKEDNEMHDDQTIEAEVTGIEETETPKETPNMIENLVKDALKLEVLRRLGVAGMERLGFDLEEEVAKVANSVAEAVQRWKKDPGTDGSSAGKLGILSSNSVISTLANVMGGTHILGGLVPIGVLAGVILASLGAVYLIVTDDKRDDGENDKVSDEEGEEEEEEEDDDEDEDGSVTDAESNQSTWQRVKASAVDVPVLSVQRHSEGSHRSAAELEEDPWMDSTGAADDAIADGYGHDSDPEGSSDDEKDEREDEREDGKQGKIMGMMAAAVTGGATLAGMNAANKDNAAEQLEGQDTEDAAKGLGKGGNIISSFQPLAEKALSVAAPVVPHKEDGEIDHERLVAMLAELGQRGGFLRLIGKVALLWGGLRGAMSLTDRLLVFLQINKRPLHVRLVGFAAMVVLLWSPVLIPVLPSLLHQWATKAPGGVADAASAVGLYGAILILVTIWGKRVRGYSKPLIYYGLRLWSKRKAQDLGLGLALGGGLVSLLYTTNFLLGFSRVNWGVLLATNPKLPGAVGVALFTAENVTKLVGQAVGIGLAVALVEEVLFRAWLQEEIAVDLGFHRAVFISAIAFAIVHWSPAAMPGLWFLSVGLACARAKMNRSLAFPIGLHAGLVAINYVMTVGGLVQYLPHAPTWFTGAHVGNPLAGALGTGMMALLAVILYPRTSMLPFPASNEAEPAV